MKTVKLNIKQREVIDYDKLLISHANIREVIANG